MVAKLVAVRQRAVAPLRTLTRRNDALIFNTKFHDVAALLNVSVLSKLETSGHEIDVA